MQMLHRYRRSFSAYTAESLTVCCLLYAILSAFFIAIFLIKYRLEYIVALPFIGFLFALYFWLSRSEEHTSELQSLMRISYAVFCLKKKITTTITSPLNTI